MNDWEDSAEYCPDCGEVTGYWRALPVTGRRVWTALEHECVGEEE